MIGVVGALAMSLSARQLDELNDDLLGKARTYGTLMAQQTTSAVAFSDRETAREVLSSLAVDTDVVAVRLYTATGEELFASGVASRWAPEAIRAREPRLFSTGPRVATVVPVISLEGPRGTLVIELSTQVLRSEQHHVALMALLTGLSAIALGALIAWWIASHLARRLRAIATVATKVADGDLEQQPVQDEARDELGLLATAFNKMLAQLRQLIERIQEMARLEKDRLETLVSERTAQLELKNLEMRQVFDQVDQGLLIATPDGSLADERSAAVERWLGPPPPSQNLIDYVRQVAPAVADWFELTWLSLGDGLLPMDVALAQIPSSFAVDGRHLELSYKPFTDAAGALRILVVITDVTAAVLRQRRERDERETVTLMSRLLSDRRGALAFVDEVSSLVDRLTASISGGVPLGEAELRRILHTIKGSCAVEQLDSLAELAHQLETLADEDLAAARARAAELGERWRTVSAPIRALLAAALERADVRERDLEQLEASLARGAPHAELARLVASWRDERVALRFERLAEHARQVAAKLGKEPFEIRVEVDEELRLPEERWAPFWVVLVHPINNAVDHGLAARRARPRRTSGSRTHSAVRPRRAWAHRHRDPRRRRRHRLGPGRRLGPSPRPGRRDGSRADRGAVSRRPVHPQRGDDELGPRGRHGGAAPDRRCHRWRSRAPQLADHRHHPALHLVARPDAAAALVHQPHRKDPVHRVVIAVVVVVALAGLGALAACRSDAIEEPDFGPPLPGASPIAGASPVLLDERAINPRLLRRFRPLRNTFYTPGVPHPIGARIDLGRMLFFDKRLSRNGDLTCNTCHDLARYVVDHKPTSIGFHSQRGSRNSLSVYLAAGEVANFWDGRAASVEEQAKSPILNPIEMAMASQQAVVDVLASIPGYVTAFSAAFPDDPDQITYEHVATAIGAFERGLVTPGRWDDFLDGDLTARPTPRRWSPGSAPSPVSCPITTSSSHRCRPTARAPRR